MIKVESFCLCRNVSTINVSSTAHNLLPLPGPRLAIGLSQTRISRDTAIGNLIINRVYMKWSSSNTYAPNMMDGIA